MNPRRVLAVLAGAELCGMAPWFSASAVAPTLAAQWRLGAAEAAWLTISVQVGFVAGALVSALRRAREMADAIEARGGIGPALRLPVRLRGADVAALVTAAGATALIAVV